MTNVAKTPVSRGVNMEAIVTVGELSRLIGIPRYRIDYAIERGRIPEPRRTLLGARRFYLHRDVEEIRRLLEKRVAGSPERP